MCCLKATAYFAGCSVNHPKEVSGNFWAVVADNADEGGPAEMLVLSVEYAHTNGLFLQLLVRNFVMFCAEFVQHVARVIPI